VLAQSNNNNARRLERRTLRDQRAYKPSGSAAKR
jgi:hypothetical protein